MERVGFKEWSFVCQAIADGRQTIIIRKGGIAEGRDGFDFGTASFFFFRRFSTNSWSRRRLPDAVVPEPLPDEIEIRYFVNSRRVARGDGWEEVRALAPFHILQESVVRERFDYEEAPGVHVAFVRVFRVVYAVAFSRSPRYGGCRSWVELPEPDVALLELC